MATVDIVLVAGFLFTMFLAGVYFSRWIKEADDFMVAGRQLTPFILAATITATNVNMYSFIGQAGGAYKSGLGIIWHTWVGNMALVFSGIFVIPIMRRLMIRTVPEFLEMRYNRHIRLFIGLIWALKLCFWLAVILMAATRAAQGITGFQDVWVWFIAFAVIAIIYSTIGGAWAVSMTDTIQFAVMMAGALVVLPIAMHAVGWMPKLLATLRANGMSEHLKFITQGQEFNWLFIISMILLSTKWACIDQAILQRAFGARDPRTVAKGMVLSGIITTPFAFLWILPALANTVLLPGIDKADLVMPMFFAQFLGVGVLGLVMCGLLASQMSTISADINSVATLFTNDIYHNLFRKASPKHLLRVVRLSTLAAGLLMILFAYYVVSRFQTVVEANLTVVGIIDMPVFVIAIVYGLFSKRTNWQGAVGGYIIGASAGAFCYKYFSGNPDLSAYAIVHTLFGADVIWAQWAKSLAALASTAAALIGVPLVSAFFPKQKMTKDCERVFGAYKSALHSTSEEEIHMMPTSAKGKLGVGLMIVGFLSFLFGVLSGSVQFQFASQMAVGGMLVFFVGGLTRVYSD
ncbi:MAG TPA: sodium:solute symporter family protein [Armatimonadota bacterium]|nr:sodium:solute symporter family protein [Armatimonadota bacterium]